MKNFQNKEMDQDSKSPKIVSPSVVQYMTKELITFGLDDNMSHVIQTLLDNRISGAPVLNELGEVVGLIDDKDCLSVLFGNVYNQLPESQDTVRNYMTSVMKTISMHESIMDVAYVFVSTPYKRLLVMDDTNKLVGQISRRDILRAIREMV